MTCSSARHVAEPEAETRCRDMASWVGEPGLRLSSEFVPSTRLEAPNRPAAAPAALAPSCGRTTCAPPPLELLSESTPLILRSLQHHQ